MILNIEKTHQVDFNKQGGLVPVIVQHFETATVLMLGYMNDAALRKTFEENVVIFYSRSKERLWQKGETSGNVLNLKSIRLDCDRDTLLIKALPSGPVCHTGAATCFNEEFENTTSEKENLNVNDNFLFQLQETIQNRKLNPSENSYTSSLFKKGRDKVAQKVGEEAVELVIEAMKDNNDDLFKNEAADLMYHYLILLTEKGFTLSDIIAVLKKRA